MEKKYTWIEITLESLYFVANKSLTPAAAASES